MNWFILTKFAQVWKIESDGSFASEVKKFYELEYKRSFLLNNKFKGLEQRKENILKGLSQELLRTCQTIKEPLSRTFETWLKRHAITNPKQWAIARTEEIYYYNDVESFDEMLYEWQKYDENVENPEQQIFNIVGDFQSLIPFFENYVQEMKQMELDEIFTSKSIEHYNDWKGTEFATIEEAESAIEMKTIADYDFTSSDYTLESFKDVLDNFGITPNFIEEFYEKIIFPLWYNYWASQGIDKTRENIENIYKELIEAKDVKDNVLAINFAINAAHQSGDMLDYLEEYGQIEHIYKKHGDLKSLLDFLSSDQNAELIHEWEGQMKEIGVIKQYNTETL